MRVVRSRVTRAAAAAACAVAVLVPLRAEAAAESPEAGTGHSWRLSGKGQVSGELKLNREGALTLSARHGSTTVLKPSALGIRTAEEDFGKGLRFEGRETK